MPASDSAIIVAALGGSLVTASVGAFVLLRAHGQRLRHERELADIAGLRRVLDAGAELLVSAEQTAQDMYHIQVGPKRLEISATAALFAYEKRLLLWVEPKDPVSTAWVDIVRVYLSVEAGSMDEMDDVLRLGSAGAVWLKAARARVGVSAQAGATPSTSAGARAGVTRGSSAATATGSA